MTPSRVVRAAVVQACSSAFSLPETLEKLERLATEAKKAGAQVAVFPEAFIGGYPSKSHFGAVLGSRTAGGRDEFLRYFQGAIEVPSATTQRIESISRALGLFLVIGVIEKQIGTLYCTVIFVDPVEGLVGKHRKLMPTAAERLVWGFGDGSTIPVLERSFAPATTEGTNTPAPVTAKLSAAICWENYMPLLRMHYYMQGTELYCAPTVDFRPEWQHTMAHIALEGRCFVLSACQFAQQKDFPHDHPIAADAVKDPEGVMIGGGSVIYGPLGNVLAGPLKEGEGVLVADLDLDDIVRGKYDLDVTGHYSRPDVFQFSLNA